MRGRPFIPDEPEPCHWIHSKQVSTHRAHTPSMRLHCKCDPQYRIYSLRFLSKSISPCFSSKKILLASMLLLSVPKANKNTCIKCLKNVWPIDIKWNRAGSSLSWFFTAAINTGHLSTTMEESNPMASGSQRHSFSSVLSLNLPCFCQRDLSASDHSFENPGTPFGLISPHWCNRHQSGNNKLFSVKLCTVQLWVQLALPEHLDLLGEDQGLSLMWCVLPVEL